MTRTPSHRRSAPHDRSYRIAGVLGVSFALVAGAHGGDILRGGAAAGFRPEGGRGAGVASAATERARANSTDALARTSRAVQSVKALQDSARNLARSNNAPIQFAGRALPKVPNGLVPGGLQVAPGVPKNLAKPVAGEDAALWVGANLPKQTASGGLTRVTIEQTKPQALLTWQTFNVGKETKLTFNQGRGGGDKSKWIAFNKVQDPSGVPSQILGTIEAPGQVYVINRNGILFGGSSQINLFTLVASSLPINDNLLTRGLLNNPDTQFLFSALPLPAGAKGTPAFNPTIADPEFRLGAGADSYTLAEQVALNSAKAPVHAPEFSFRAPDSSKTMLIEGADYTLSVPSTTRKATATFTAAGLAKVGGAPVSVIYTPVVVKTGDVVVQPGARISSPVSAEGNGGRVMLVGANVRNEGSISTPAGQTILAAGLQVGVEAHKSSDASLRGLDVFVGKVAVPPAPVDAENPDAPKPLTPAVAAGAVTNSGLIEVARGNASLAGKSVNQFGAIDSTTSVSLNGRIDLAASYNAVSNPAYDPAVPTTGSPFLFGATGSVTLGPDSVTQILPEIWSDEKAVGLELALRSQVNLQGRTIRLGSNAMVLAPNATVALRAGRWIYQSDTTPPRTTFLSSGGQVYFDSGAFINVAGSTDAIAPIAQNILSLQLRGAELAPSPLQRNGLLRGPTFNVDLRHHGTFNGREWVGTPLGDVTGFLGLIERTVGELTAAGGTVDISAGGSVVLQKGSLIDVSGGSVTYEGGMVKTTRVMSAGQLFDLAEATPDRIYDGIYTGTSTFTSAKWGVTETFTQPLARSGEYFQPTYTHGMDAGSIKIAAPSMALDGELLGKTAPGPRQFRDSATTSLMPKPATLSLAFHAQDPTPPQFYTVYPTPPRIEFRADFVPPVVAPFALDASGDPLELDERRRALFVLSPALLAEKGFGSLIISNPDGDVLVPTGVNLATGPGGTISLTAANIDVRGSVTSPGGTIEFTALNFSPYEAALLTAIPGATAPPPNAGRGKFTLAAGASLNAAGLVLDERAGSRVGDLRPIKVHGGTVKITAFTADLAAGSVIDVSGGVVVTELLDDDFDLPIKTPTDHRRYGNGGRIEIKTGQDATLLSVLGGELKLGATLRGFSGAHAGSLSIQAPLIQIGGAARRPETLLLDPQFFSTGGFGSFSLTGIGAPAGAVDVPEVFVAPGTIIEPVAQSSQVIPHPGGAQRIALGFITKAVGERTPVSIELKAPGVTDTFLGGLAVRGDLVLGEGAVIRTDPRATLALSGNTVAVLGSLYAPAGFISIRGGTNTASVFGGAPLQAQTTTYIGPKSVLSVAGTTIFTPEPFGRRIGEVLPGGLISVVGNIVAAAGAVLDVSGASATLDLAPPVAAALDRVSIPVNSGLTAPLASLRTGPTRVDSDAGAIVLEGGQMLFSDATLLGHAGGPTALGGSLLISSGRFYADGATPRPFHTNLVVTQNGATIPTPLAADGSAIGLSVGPASLIGQGYFAASTFARGGFDSLALKGVVDFRGPVTITARGVLAVADGGVLYADSDVRLTAPYVALGRALESPVRPEDRKAPFLDGNQPLFIPPAHGAGRLIVNAGLIDVGTLSLQNIGRALLDAGSGDIRGSGIFNIAGDLRLQAGQVYPVSASDFTIAAYDYKIGDATRSGSVAIRGSGAPLLPMSAGGTLSIYASTITHTGTLRAPLGTIHLGWDGTGAAPTDLLTGTALPFPVTKQLTLGAGSITSVSAVDPTTGEGILIPYGISPDGNSWIDPHGVDVTAGGLPEKSVRLGAQNIAMQAGSTIDLRGGGDLYAYRWVEGNGGPADILASSGSFAVIPGYGANFSPVAPFNDSALDTNLIRNLGPGYVNDTLRIGDRIYLNGSASLAAGYYTLLPARYALLPGAVLVTPKSGRPLGTIETPEGASFVAGYRFNDLNSARTVPTTASWFEVASASVVRARAEYQDYFANEFLTASAQALSIDTPRLPTDSGYLLFQATQSMQLFGAVASPSISGGRGSAIDIATPRNIVINETGTGGGAGVVSLSASILNSFGAESLLIGGKRVRGENGTTIEVQSGSITVGKTGVPLSAPDLTLAAKAGLTIEAGAQVASTGALTSPAETFLLSGDGVLLRVSADSAAAIVRTEVTPSTTPTLTIGAGARISGVSLILDSTAGLILDRTTGLDASHYTFNAGRISLLLDSRLLDDPDALQPDAGLVLVGTPLENLQSASSLSLLSYKTLDLYGTGEFGGGLGRLSLNAGAIRGFKQGDGTVRIAAKSITLGNLAGVANPAPVNTTSGTLQFDAGTIRLTRNQLAIDQYATVVLNAASGIVGEGAGGLSTQGALTANTPVLTGTAGANRTITAGGELTLTAPAGSASARMAGGLGSTLSLTGTKVLVTTDILLPSGSLSIRATTDDLTIGGRLDVGGTSQQIYDVTRFTDAGEIRLSAENGDVILNAESVLRVAAQTGGGNAGTLIVSSANGAFTSAGTLLGSGGAGGRNGSFTLDTATLPSLTTLAAALTEAGLTESQTLRVRTGNVLLDGVARTRNFQVSTDAGGITVTGTIDASGATGGTIRLVANGGVVLANGALLTVAGEDFSNAGKGGAIYLEAGAQTNGVLGSGIVDIQTGSTLDLSVASKIAGDALTPGSSAYHGEFSGKLHLRAAQNATFSDVLVNPINGTILDASSILIEGYRLYDLTASGGAITTAVQNSIHANSQAFLGTAGTASANFTAMTSRLLANNAALESVFVLAPGAELINRTGNLTLGTTSSPQTSDWNLSTFRYGAKSAPGVLTLRAAGNLVFLNALSDGFAPNLANTNASWLHLARLTNQNALLPVNTQSWSYRLAAGADLGAADFGQVLPTSALGANAGFLQLGKNNGNNTAGSGNNALTSAAIANRYQVIRTGSGDIEINTGRSVQLLNQFATIYTAGTRVANPTLGGTFDLPILNQTGGEITLGANQQLVAYPALYSMAGGNVTIRAQENVEHLTRNNAGQLVADSQRELPNNWLYRRGFVDPVTGEFGVGRFNDTTTTTWWVDFSNFFQGIGALGGGDLTVLAGRDISNVDAVIPTNARLPKGTPGTTALLELGGGDLTVRAGGDLDAGVYYVERGRGSLTVGGQITTNATRSPSLGNLTAANTILDAATWLPTMLFVAKGGFDVSARGDVLLGPVGNPFLLPPGINNTYWHKSYFSTYAPESFVNVSSLGGSVTLRTEASLGGTATPLLQVWAETQQLLGINSAAFYQPWLRLAENSVQPFSSVVALMPPTLRATAFSGDIHLAGDLTLAPATRGTIELLAGGAINALQPNGTILIDGQPLRTWASSRINVSDADPAAIPGITTPFGYQSLVGLNQGQAIRTINDFLEPVARLFRESGSTLGEFAVLQTKQALHAPGPLHLDDPTPIRLYASGGDIAGLTLFSPKDAQIFAGRDITDVALYVQNVHATDTSIVASGRDIVPYNANAPLRVAASATGNIPAAGEGPMAGDIQISGPGTLQVIAGRNLDLGTGANNADGTGVGITSIGNARNPSLGFTGANIIAGAGVAADVRRLTSSGESQSLLTSAATGLSSALDFETFIQEFVEGAGGQKYLDELADALDGRSFEELAGEERNRIALEIFYRVLRDAGRDFPTNGNYDKGFAAIRALFGEATGTGEILTRSRDIRTRNGGDISLFAPVGGLVLANTTIGDPLSPPGIITESGGNISIFTDGDVDIGIGRIFTLRGGNEIIWSSQGDIAAGAASKTVQSAPPTRVLIDPQTASVQTDLAGLATGGGIGVLATVQGVPPGNVDLIAPAGTIDAGDAGIRVSGNLSIAAVQVLNADNIAVTGTSIGTPNASTVATPSFASLASPSNAASAATNAAGEATRQATRSQAPPAEDMPSMISVEVLGYGGGDGGSSEDDEEERRRREEPANADHGTSDSVAAPF